MLRVLLLGGGKIGRMIAKLLTDTGDYSVCVADRDADALARLTRLVPAADALVLDVTDDAALAAALQGRDAVVSALSFHHNPRVAEAALQGNVSYFDLTEDIATTARVRAISTHAKPGQVFVPQCGLAPGFVSIVAYDLTRHFDKLDTVHMRVGALPQFPNNTLKYNLTWSTDGLINEYCNPCDAIVDGQRREVLPLEGLEHFSLDGVRYEAFNTSGALGTLCETLDGQVRELNYKTIRYLGHRDLMEFLVRGLRLFERRELLKDILERAIPVTFQDVVVIFCTVTGFRREQFVQLSDARKVYRQTISGENWSAIQVTTAAGVCAMLDLFVERKVPMSGFVRQEAVRLDDFLSNRFGRHYDCKVATRFTWGAEKEDEP